MGEVNYYELLGISESASPDDIKRAYVQKRRDFQNDVEKTTLLNQAYSVLTDAKQRREYDAENKYGKRLSGLWEKYNNCEDADEKKKILSNLKNVYDEIISDNPHSISSLKKLYEIESILGKEKEALRCLSLLADEVLQTDSEDKIQMLEYVGQEFAFHDMTDDAIKVYFPVYQHGVGNPEPILNMVRLLYKEKRNVKAAIKILNDCINRSDTDALKMTYLGEAILAVSGMEGDGYKKVKKVFWKKLSGIKPTDSHEKEQIALSLLMVMAQCLNNDKTNDSDLKEFERIYLSYGIKDSNVDKVYSFIKQTKKAIEAGKYHEAIDLFIEDRWTDKTRQKLNDMILSDIINIRESLAYIKKYAPLFWEAEKEALEGAEKIINNRYEAVIEYQKLSINTNLSKSLHTLVRLLLSPVITFDSVESEFREARIQFFAEENLPVSRQELVILERLYPHCYKRFSDVFLDGESTAELFGDTNPNSAGAPSENANIHDERANASNSEADSSDGKKHQLTMGELLVIIGLVIACLAFPPLLIIVGIVAFIGNHAKTIKKLVKSVIVLACIAAVIAGIENWVRVIKSHQETKRAEEYRENHDYVLTDAELKKCDELDKKYSKKTNVNIHVEQTGNEEVGDLGEADCIWLLIRTSPGYQNEVSLKQNCLSYEQADELWQELYELYDGDKPDFEKCEAFYELAYQYAKSYEESLISVPDLVGMDIEDAERIAADYGFHIGKNAWECSDMYEENTIMYQYTRAGERIFKGDTILVDISLGKEVPYNDGVEPGGIVENEVQGYTYDEVWQVQLNDIYEMLTKGYTTDDIKASHPNGILTDVEGYLLEYYGYFGTYYGYFSYCEGCPIYGLGDEDSEYRHFSWASDFDTICPDSYINQLYELQYIVSGYHDDARVTIYEWENKLILSVLQGEDDTLIQIAPIGNYPINFW